MNTILAIVQAEKEGQIESKLIKARQMEEIREARRVEAAAKEAERDAEFSNTKDSIRKGGKKKRSAFRYEPPMEGDIKDYQVTGINATKPKKKRVSFANE